MIEIIKNAWILFKFFKNCVVETFWCPPHIPNIFSTTKNKNIFCIFCAHETDRRKKITLHNSRKKKNAQKNIKKKKINLENKNEQKYWRRMKLYCFKKKIKKIKIVKFQKCEIKTITILNFSVDTTSYYNIIRRWFFSNSMEK